MASADFTDVVPPRPKYPETRPMDVHLGRLQYLPSKHMPHIPHLERKVGLPGEVARVVSVGVVDGDATLGLLRNVGQ